MTPEDQASVNALVNSLPKEPGDFCREEAFANWQAEHIESGGMYRLGTPRADRFSRCWDAAEHGSDGSTHAEHIQDFRDYAAELFDAADRELWKLDLSFDDNAAAQAALELREGEFDAACDALESWHERNGTLNEAIG